MHKLFVVLFLSGLFYGGRSVAQDSQHLDSTFLSSYYTIKNALVAGDAHTAAQGATALVKVINGAAAQVLSSTQRDALLKAANPIAAKENLEQQRSHFSDLSASMMALAKSMKLSATPVYEVYCPMKKAYWLSADKAIQNPYFGSAMSSCGKVVETL